MIKAQSSNKIGYRAFIVFISYQRDIRNRRLVLTAAAALSVLVMMLVLDTTLYSLMLVAEQIVHGLHWVECTERNLYEYCIPVAHRTIPETWQLECLQILTILTLAGDETGRWINELRKIEGIALIILGSADEIYWVEVSTLGEHLHILLVILVNLRALHCFLIFSTTSGSCIMQPQRAIFIRGFFFL